MKNLILTILFSVFFLPLAGQGKGSLEIYIENLRNSQGDINITLFNSPDGFPEDIDKAYKIKSLPVRNDKNIIRIKNLPAGEYAFAILHDEDENGEMKKNLVGIPREGFGFSKNFRPRMKNPEFSDASFRLKSGKNVHRIQVIYF